MSIPKTLNATVTSTRIPALDFWRGLYLLMIYINHVPNNPLPMLTLRSWGFADSAEIFVFISGFSAMLAFGPYFEFGGYGAGLLRVIKPHGSCFAPMFCWFCATAKIALAGVCGSKQIMEQLNFTPFFTKQPWLLLADKLGYMPNMTIFYPSMLSCSFLSPYLGLMKRSTFWVWCFFMLWLGLMFPVYRFPLTPKGNVVFQPPCMATSFCGGMMPQERTASVRFLSTSSSLGFWFAVAITSALLIAPWTNLEILSSWKIIPYESLPLDNKTNLSWMRVGHFMALAVIGVHLVANRPRFWTHRAVKAVSLCGRHSLAIFCAGTALSLLMHVLLLMV
jgi:hypothetical protein